MDEGGFLTKGYLFVTGRYTLFEDYGPWTNNMPLAYIIPGIPQAIFGPSLAVGRYFAICTATLTLLAIWITVNRICGKWWALFSVASLAINNAWVALNVQVFSQVTVACFVSWMLVFLLGKKRTAFQISIAGILAALAVLTRQNMIFLFPFIFLLTLWQHGLKMAIISLLAAALPFLGMHFYFYPKILNLWVPWSPWIPNFLKSITVVETQLSVVGKKAWQPDTTSLDRISSFFISLRYYFIPILTSIFSLPLINFKKNWKNKHEWKMAISLLGLFIIFFGMHAWASLGNDYCVFCLSNYITFFIPIGVVFMAITLKGIFENEIHLSFLFIVLVVLSIIPGIMFSSKDTVGRYLLELPVPRIKSGKLIGGTTAVWELLRNRFGIPYDSLQNLLPPMIGLFTALVLIIVFHFIFTKQQKISDSRKGNVFSIIIVIISFVLTPTALLSRFPLSNTCGGDALMAYEKAGKRLQDTIPESAHIYWGSGSQVTPLLYLADRNIQPLQLNGVYNKILAGDRKSLEQIGFYTAESESEWRETADYVLIQARHMGDFFITFLDPSRFDELAPTVPFDPCDPNTAIKIFKRK